MQVGTGKSVLNGIAIGKLKIYKKKDTAISAAEVADTAAEVARFEEAQQKAIEQQTALYEKALAEAGEDIEITAREIRKTKQELYEIIAAHSGAPIEKIEKDADRDYWLSAREAKEYGLIDEVLTKRG